MKNYVQQLMFKKYYKSCSYNNLQKQKKLFFKNKYQIFKKKTKIHCCYELQTDGYLCFKLQVGLGMAIQGLANIAMTLIAGRFSFHFGLTPIIIFALIFELCIYIVQLMWTINYHTRYYIFLLAACSGITGGTWQLTLICKY